MGVWFRNRLLCVCVCTCVYVCAACLTLLCPQDVFEDHKVAAFKEMVQGFETIGIPESGDPRRTIEKWPIIQSYAVDEQVRTQPDRWSLFP